MFYNFNPLILLLDCNTPSLAGYRYTGYGVTTYNEQSNVTCAPGYDGTASPSTVTCMDSGDWTTVTGCTIKGTITLLTHLTHLS